MQVAMPSANRCVAVVYIGGFHMGSIAPQALAFWMCLSLSFHNVALLL
jgi:hypothetical protein